MFTLWYIIFPPKLLIWLTTFNCINMSEQCYGDVKSACTMVWQTSGCYISKSYFHSCNGADSNIVVIVIMKSITTMVIWFLLNLHAMWPNSIKELMSLISCVHGDCSYGHGYMARFTKWLWYLCCIVYRWGRLRASMMPWPGLLEPFTECLTLAVVSSLSLCQLFDCNPLWPFCGHVILWLFLDICLLFQIQVNIYS